MGSGLRVFIRGLTPSLIWDERSVLVWVVWDALHSGYPGGMQSSLSCSAQRQSLHDLGVIAALA